MHHRLFPLVIVLSSALFSSGCQTMRAYRQARKAYQLTRRFHEFSATTDASVDTVYQALLGALADLGIESVVNQVDKLSGRADAYFADNMHLSVCLRVMSGGQTRILIRCGVPGDRMRAEEVYRAIQNRLTE